MTWTELLRLAFSAFIHVNRAGQMDVERVRKILNELEGGT